MEKIGKVTNAKILNEGRCGLNGVSIEFKTDTKINNQSVIQISFKDKLKPFNVKSVEIVDGMLLGNAIECGYWARKLDRDKDLDLRELIGCDVNLVTDDKTLKQIHEASCWC